ncbi:cobalt-precorrin-5B (C(1))-methyltransferase [Alkalimarinus alittae]|uniref:Cobalt-precorrin-5B C(1)-methyltransferase n=1 Tax=Alkalimarinus alittae TaxID=2961619 RepID=A0ABY6N5T3_9ALTE|nr:cobalt-precorrin-5B (C(1))-methyltransferase [Alkalimarinus alittae]UZE97482.1 cobalt-precorrin-5B (C(1))-methyltransferase [Alkalimarinus alittae]
MWTETSENIRPLRSGLTTGCCATACSVAAAQYLFTNTQPEIVSVTLPRGKVVELTICDYQLLEDGVVTSTIKDAGDDPDATHGATVFVELRLIAQTGVYFKAGPGVGTVTRDGLLLAVGEPAINPVPRRMMTEHLQHLAGVHNYAGGFEVTVGIKNGETIALKTMNPRLGIMGGLSILGTTGIVRPFSCAAYIASIHQGIDVAKANGINHIAATTGSSSEAAIRDHYQLDDIALIEMGDFVGAVFKHLKRVQVGRLSICGGFGKISKLADGHLDLNSRVSAINFDFLARAANELGGSVTLCEKIKASNTSIEALKHCQLAGVDLASALCRAALLKARTIVPSSVELEVWAIDRKGAFVGCARDSDVTKGHS